ncbi:MAG: hypothetical protein ACJATN_001562 [Neolewinella sp.]|jgi:hypothetical protein
MLRVEEVKRLFAVINNPKHRRILKIIYGGGLLARLFNEASGQKAPSKKHGLFISRPLATISVWDLP